MTPKERMAALIEAGEKATKGDSRPVAWQKFGNQYMLTGQYADRPIYFRGEVHDADMCLLVEPTPDHPDCAFITQAANARDTIKLAAEIVEAARDESDYCRMAYNDPDDGDHVDDWLKAQARLDALLEKWEARDE
jgi:hypothetical protein